jgi:hypothetical protein
MNNYYFIIKETESQMEIIGGSAEYTVAYETYQELVNNWSGRTSVFYMVSCPLVQTTKVYQKGEVANG